MSPVTRMPKDDRDGRVSYGTANRDPSVSAEPEEFRLDRNLSNHVALGRGIHYCLGAPLARTEACIALNVFLDRFERIERSTAPVVRQNTTNVVLGFRELPVCVCVG